jgi:hypothetical protein
MTDIMFISSEQDIKPIVDSKVDDFLNTCVQDIKDIMKEDYSVVSGYRECNHKLHTPEYNELVDKLKEHIKLHVLFCMELHSVEEE